MSEVVNILTLISQTELSKGRYCLSFDVIPKKSTQSLIKTRKGEPQEYVEHEIVHGSTSPKINLRLGKNKQCDVTFSVEGSLQPRTRLQQGENVLEFDKALTECRKFLHLVPSYDRTSDGIAFIKFKVNETVKHTVSIVDVPTQRPGPKQYDGVTSTERNMYMQSFGDTVSGHQRSVSETELDKRSFSTRQNSSGGWRFSSTGSEQSSGLGRQASTASSTSLRSDRREDVYKEEQTTAIHAGSVREQFDETFGDPVSGGDDVQAIPLHPRQFVNAQSATPTYVPSEPTAQQPPPVQMRLPAPNSSATPVVCNKVRQSTDGSSSYDDVTGPEENQQRTAYERILSNESLRVFAGALAPSDATRLIIALGVPNAVLKTNQKNNPGDIVSATFDSLQHWRSTSSASTMATEAESKHMFEDLLKELADMGRNDLKMVLKRVLEENRKIESKDFKHY